MDAVSAKTVARTYLQLNTLLNQQGEISIDGLKMKYFVLNPTKDDPYGQASRQALRAYALSICDVNPSLADDLRKWASDEETNKRK